MPRAAQLSNVDAPRDAEVSTRAIRQTSRAQCCASVVVVDKTTCTCCVRTFVITMHGYFDVYYLFTEIKSA